MAEMEAPSRKKKIDRNGFSIYLYRMLKSIDDKATINRKAMKCVNSMITDLCTRLAKEAGELVELTGKSTIQAREIRAATNLLIRGELGHKVAAEGAEALARFNSSSIKKAGAKMRHRSRKSSRSTRAATM